VLPLHRQSSNRSHPLLPVSNSKYDFAVIPPGVNDRCFGFATYIQRVIGPKKRGDPRPKTASITRRSQNFAPLAVWLVRSFFIFGIPGTSQTLDCVMLDRLATYSVTWLDFLLYHMRGEAQNPVVCEKCINRESPGYPNGLTGFPATTTPKPLPALAAGQE
jgi:hypothetical protein